MPTASKTRQSLSVSRDLLSDIHEFGVNLKSREIYLHSQFDKETETGGEEETGVDYRMANSFIKNLNFLNSISTGNILVHQQSMGGDYQYGISIYDALMASPATTTMLAYAWARSMSSITIQACDNRVLLPNTDFMVHLGSLWVGGSCQEVYSEVEQCKIADETMLRVYASRCINGPFFQEEGYDKSDIKSFIRNNMSKKVDWWISPTDAIKYGFVDGILGTPGFETIEKIRKTKRNRQSAIED
jgi:ATP-dependent Clp protease protease subunit